MELNRQAIHDKLNNLNIEHRCFVSGSFYDGKELDLFNKISPIDGRELPGIGIADRELVNRAVSAARESYRNGKWARTKLSERKQVLLKLAEKMSESRWELALLDTIETGRSVKNYYCDSIPKAIEVVRWFAEASDKYLDFALPPQSSHSGTITREPLGVVAGITPWNDPLVPAMWKLAPALLMGNSVIMKPAEESSYSLLKIAELLSKCGLPKGTLSVLTGTGEITGKLLALHPEVDGVFFTGSSEVGKLILQYSGQSNMKKVGLECGGKSPFIISKNCSNVKAAAETLAQNMFYNQGQICSAPSLAFVHESLREEFKVHLKTILPQFQPGDPLNPESNIGGVVSEQQRNRILTYVETGKKDQVEFYEPEPKTLAYPDQQCVNPICFFDAPESHDLFKEEVFGPVLVVNSFSNLAEAVNSANNTNFGLAASIWTNDLNESYHVSRELRAGIVHINSYGQDDMSAPFGGIKQSGLGKDKSLFAFDEYTHLKTIWTEYPSSKSVL
tara:strand:- start:21254 stop:22765 length:1512 start_codon:yes stop_codon:yes gene_type:complete